MTEYNGGSIEAEHLCVLVHGLWGSPKHMASAAKALRNQFPEDKLHLLVAKRNSGYFTYDGIELGGERVCVEIEEELAAIKARGGKITKLSIVGYSLGGLVARYAIGLLHAKGVLDKLDCVNFTAFASPFLGVRSPIRGWAGRLFNGFGARTLSKSGHQLFGIDKFRDTGRPLLAVLADPDSIFMSGLARFRRRTLYANVANDRTAVYYTTGISKTDPYTDLSKVKVRYVKGYEDVVLDPSDPVTPLPRESWEVETLSGSAAKWIKRVPLVLALVVFVPIGMSAYLISAGVQSVQSTRRIKQHEDGRAGIDISRYRVPLWMKGVQETVEGAYESLNSAQRQEFLIGAESDSDGDDLDSEAHKILSLERRMSQTGQPTLALSPDQFTMIQSLDNLGWRKYPVWIHKINHSHAAIVVRSDASRFDEGRIVLKHWTNEEFLI